MTNRIKKFIRSSYFSKITKSVLSLIAFLIAVTLLTAINTYLSLNQFSAGNFARAQDLAQQAKKSSQLLVIFTFKQSHLVLTWKQGLETLSLTANILEQAQQNSSLKLNGKTTNLSSKVNQLSGEVRKLSYEFDQSWLLKLFLSSQIESKINSYLNLAADLTSLTYWTKVEQTAVAVLLQNKDEIRASGGFLGSLAMVSLNQLQIQQIDFYDAYDINGQINTLLPPVPGAKDYLTQGKGLNFTDANWHADFPTACSQINELLKQVELKPDITIALNQELIEQVIDIIGPIYLPDYQLELTGNNFTQLARENRSKFFSGDKQKKYFLETAFQQMKIKLEKTNFDQKKQLFFLIKNSLDQQQILVHAKQKNMQDTFAKYSWTGALESHFSENKQEVIYLVESNVGINKANQKVERKVQLIADSEKNGSAEIELSFFNNNQPLSQKEAKKIEENPDLLQAPHLGYVNYQRIITQPQTEVVSVSCQQKNITIKENRLISSSKQNEFRQTGFLVTVPEQNQVKCVVKLKTTSGSEKNKWMVKLQPGLN
ncbi:MAG: DUF4012 domain-containing protein [Patescibacteria group bacterium]|nr:DUF4012 domain-containing protein [Patescibacteria group bacterium]